MSMLLKQGDMTSFRNGITCDDCSSWMILNEVVFQHTGAVNMCRCAHLRQGLGIQSWPKRIYQSIKFAVVGGIIRHWGQLNSSRNMTQRVKSPVQDQGLTQGSVGGSDTTIHKELMMYFLFKFVYIQKKKKHMRFGQANDIQISAELSVSFSQ